VTAALTESSVLQACSTLFGLDPHACTGLLGTLEPAGAKSAYRKKAKETHPDLFHNQSRSVQQRQTLLFREILSAYETLNRFFKEKEEGRWKQKISASPRQARPAPRRDTTAASQPAPKTEEAGFYHGPIPLRVLEFGRYLYFSGLISYAALIDALMWQRKQRPSLGSVALRWGWLTKDSVQRISATRTVRGRFGERAVLLGLLTPFQVNTILYYQRTLQTRLGSYFAQKNLLTQEQLEALAAKMMHHNAHVIAQKQAESRRRNTYM
jgi:hypothetical protein